MARRLFLLLPILLSAVACAPSRLSVSPPPPLAAFLPDLSTIPGLVRADSLQAFERENLWINLNGAAEYYLDYGCARMVTRTFQVEDGVSPPLGIIVKIFDMQTPLNAFGLFSQFRSTSALPLDLGDGAAVADSDLLFHQGRYLVDVLLFDPSQSAPDRLRQFGQQVSARLPAGAGLPPSLKLLPDEHRVPRTERFIPQNILGYAFLARAVAADYQLGDQFVRLFVLQCDDANAARQTLDRFAATLQDTHPLAPPLGDQSIAGTDPFAGLTFAFAQGTHLALVQEITDSDAIRPLLSECSRTIARYDAD